METRTLIKPDELEKKIEALKKKASSNPAVIFKYLLASINQNHTDIVKKIFSEKMTIMSAEQIRTLMLLCIKKGNFEGLQAAGNYFKSIENFEIDETRDKISEVLQAEIKENIFGIKNSLPNAAGQKPKHFLNYLLENHFINADALLEISKKIGEKTISIEMTNYILSYGLEHNIMTWLGQPLADYILNELLNGILTKSLVNNTTLGKLFLLFDQYHAKPPGMATPLSKKLIEFLNKYKQEAVIKKNPTQIGRIAYIQSKLIRARTSRQNDPIKNEAEAQPYVQEAAEKNWPDACLEMGLVHLEQKNYKTALDYFEKSKENSTLTKTQKATYIIEKMAAPLALDVKKANDVVRSPQFTHYFVNYISSCPKGFSNIKEDANILLMMAHWIPIDTEHAMRALALAYRAYCKAINEKDKKTEAQALDDIYNHFLPEIIKHKKIPIEIDFMADKEDKIQSKLIQLIVDTLEQDKKQGPALLLCDIAVMLPGLIDFAMAEENRNSTTIAFINHLKKDPARYVDFVAAEQLAAMTGKEEQLSSLTTQQGPTLFAPKGTTFLPKTNKDRETLEALFLLTPEEKEKAPIEAIEGIKKNILDAYQKEGEEINIEKAQLALKQIEASPAMQGAESEIIREILQKIDRWLADALSKTKKAPRS